ncbi:hypothetical protein K438DRAFT_1824899 [Mycena galopus ATCC 62051]|nr:hypothetical protein K438DRAFT_1824899 [Mycena galopus ATCC 62051]
MFRLFKETFKAIEETIVGTPSAIDAAVTRERAIELHNQGVKLSGAGHRQDALKVYAETVGLLRTRPENLALTKILATTLSNMGLDFSAVGRHEDAVRAEIEAIQLRRKLLETDPSISTDLASSLYWLGVRLQAAGRHEEALNAHEEAVRILRRRVYTILVGVGLAQSHL